MSRMRSPHLLVALVLFGAACSDGSDSSGKTATQTIDEAGGTVSVEGATLTIPPSALASPTAISVASTTAQAPSGYAGLSPVFRFEPDGLTFSQPVTVRLPFSGEPSGAAIYWSRSDGTYERLESTVEGSTLTATTTHFCTAFVGREVEPEDPGVDPNAKPVGFAGSCALASDGTVRCWSAGFDQKPVPVEGLAGAAELAAGNAHYCARLNDGSVRCWGGSFNPQPTAVAGLTSVAQIAARGDYTCARLTDGAVKCWGQNEFGQLGDSANGSRATPFTVPLSAKAVEIALSLGSACARLEDATVACWGSNLSGQLGSGGERVAYNPPTAVSGLSGAVGIAAGGSHLCARLADGVVCWGLMLIDYYGSYVDAVQATPQAVSGLSSTLALALGDDFSCALLSGGEVRCWGQNSQGELGDGTSEVKLTPTASLVTGADLIAVAGNPSSGGNLQLSIARTSGGALKAWGKLPGATAPILEPTTLAW